jgi:hypothetical protein
MQPIKVTVAHRKITTNSISSKGSQQFSKDLWGFSKGISDRASFRPSSTYIQLTETREERDSEPMGLDDLQFEAVDVAVEEEEQQGQVGDDL